MRALARHEPDLVDNVRETWDARRRASRDLARRAAVALAAADTNIAKANVRAEEALWWEERDVGTWAGHLAALELEELADALRGIEMATEILGLPDVGNNAAARNLLAANWARLLQMLGPGPPYQMVATARELVAQARMPVEAKIQELRHQYQGGANKTVKRRRRKKRPLSK